MDNFNDDGLEPGPKKERGTAFIYQNRISRCLSPFTVHVFRNIVDLRQGTYRSPPDKADPSGEFLNSPTTLVAHDHGGPTHAVYYVYHNTFLLPGNAYRGYYAFAWGGHTRGTTRRVFNNIFMQVAGVPGLNFDGTSPEDDFQADGDLLWSVKEGASVPGDFFEAARPLPWFEASKKPYPPGWGAHDILADPLFVSLENPVDFRLRADSPAIDAGVELPAAWPDPFRPFDKGKPDVGALPLGAVSIDTPQPTGAKP